MVVIVTDGAGVLRRVAGCIEAVVAGRAWSQVIVSSVFNAVEALHTLQTLGEASGVGVCTRLTA